MIPSTWLSIILRFSGRSENDYKAYCLFMGLRQHQNEDDTVHINPVPLLKSLAKRTADKNVKQLIIEEIINNRSSYPISSENDYPIIIQNAFDEILRKSSDAIRAEMKEQFDNKNKSINLQIDDLKRQIKEQSTYEETATKIANNIADRKIAFWEKFDFIYNFRYFIMLIAVTVILTGYYFCVHPIYEWLQLVITSINARGVALSANSIIPGISFLISVIPMALCSPLEYLSSDKRRAKLIKRYKEKTLSNLK